MSGPDDQVVDYQEGSATYYHAGNAIVVRLRSLDRSRFAHQYAARMTLDQARELWKDLGYALGETDPAVNGAIKIIDASEAQCNASWMDSLDRCKIPCEIPGTEGRHYCRLNDPSRTIKHEKDHQCACGASAGPDEVD